MLEQRGCAWSLIGSAQRPRLGSGPESGTPCPNIMWFLQLIAVFLAICGIIGLITFLLKHYGSSVKVNLISTDSMQSDGSDHLPLDTSKEDRAAWVQSERKRVRDLEAIPPEIRKA